MSSGVKASGATTVKRSKGGQFVIHAKALPGNPYDGHTLASVIPKSGKAGASNLQMPAIRGHNAPFLLPSLKEAYPDLQLYIREDFFCLA